MTQENISSPFRFIIKDKHDRKNIYKQHSKSFKTLLNNEANKSYISKDLKNLKFLFINNTNITHEKSENLNKFIRIQKFRNKKHILCSKEKQKFDNKFIKHRKSFNEDIIQSDEEFPIMSTNINDNYDKKELKNPFLIYNSNKIIEKNINNHFIPYIFSNFKQTTLNMKPTFSFIKTLMLPPCDNIVERKEPLLNWTPSKKKNFPFLEKGIAKMILEWVIEYQSQNTLHNYSNTKIKEHIFIITETKKDRNMNNIYFYGYEKFTENIKILFLLTGKYLSQNEINEGALLSLYEPIINFQNTFSRDIIICTHWSHKNLE
ncbi:uncharacterized protein T551_02568 [Pneumocystis jirovecii RU7]|uniref:Uncharacterized protein n=1 Tax=Pneumocystis jirovecii (strain RU7) TaxID=1408657 RepID=A0A0W4ZK00_PNEJ7|nr:uncharacterized protein T551_02568 [Pneumocystis jirovecii RU7]KTW28718.1 hypothetical protein T551_02568 [Pneumocystis jirovecii RU7]